MKRWKKLLTILLGLVLMLSAVLLVGQEEKPCCLCSSFRYHAPCLIDLETGDLTELTLYIPHDSKVAELAEVQPEVSTFSFVRLGNVEGTQQTGSKIIELTVPRSQRTTNPALCRACKKQLTGLFPLRYALADLYDMEKKILIPIRPNLSMELRCYEITAQKAEDKTITLTIQGILETNP